MKAGGGEVYSGNTVRCGFVLVWLECFALRDYW